MLGLERERFQLVWCSSAEAERFVAAIRDMTETVREVGPSPYRREAQAKEIVEEVVACRSL